MATIRTAIQIQDKMTPAFKSMNVAMNIVLNTFEKLQKTSSNAVDTSSIQTAREELARANVIINQAEDEINQANNAQDKFNNNIRNGTNSADGLLGKVKQIALTVASMAGMQKVLDLSDQVSSNSARLGLIVDDNGSVEELEDKIFASAMRSRSYYLDTANVISKLGILAGSSFKNNDELIAFTELMNKNFIIGGASIQEQTSAMYQLTQAMAAGKLQGDEFRSIMENAPLLAEAIAEYTGKTKGELKEMSSEGVITADIIKNAMFSTADEINDRFEKMPMTWAQIWNKMKNIALKAFEPVLKKLNQIANNPQFQEAFNSLINVLSITAQAVLGVIEGMLWLYNILEPFAPIILGIVAAYVAFNAVKAIYNTITAISAFVTGILTAAQVLHTGASIAEAAATTTATGAQIGLNAAMLAFPGTWIVMIIMAIIVALAYLWFTNEEVAYGILFAWDSLRLGGMILWLGLKAVFYGILLAAQYMWLGMLGVCYGLLYAWYMFQTGLEGVGVGILYIFQWLYNGVVGIVNAIIGVLNKIPGVSIDTVEYANFADNALGGLVDNVTKRNEDLQAMVDNMNDVTNAIEKSKSEYMSDLYNGATDIQNTAIDFNATRDDRVAHRNDWINGASGAIKDAMNMDNYDFSSMGTDLGNIGSDLGKISGDTGSIKNSLDVTEEDLKYLRDLAEQEVINRFTTAEIKIDMTNNNNINSEADLDGIINTLSEGLYETMTIAAEGVHE